MKRRKLGLLGTAVFLLVPIVYFVTRPAVPSNSDLTLVSAGYHLDKIYRSMEGPWSVQRGFQLEPAINKPKTKNDFVWLTGLETQVVDATNQTPASQEFFCHANLTFAQNNNATQQSRGAARGGKIDIDARLFTLAPGRTSIELPAGFGLPVPADASLDYLTMSLNMNPRQEPIDVRMRTKLHIVAADQSGAPTKALFRRAVYVLQRESPSGSNEHSSCNAKKAQDDPGLGCGEWRKVSLPNGSTALVPGEGMTNHWTVGAGDHVYTSDITPQLNLPFDTTVHYATIHVHPFARWMELRDVTAGKTILHLTSRDWPDRLGVAHVDEFKSIDGIPISRGHHYELAVEYNNTSGASTDAMAILYLYMLDKNS